MVDSRLIYLLIFCSNIFCVAKKNAVQVQTLSPSRNYYFSNAGKDDSDGSINHPLKSLKKLNQLSLKGGDTVFLKGGDIFPGTIFIANTTGKLKPVVINSYAKGKAIIDGGDSAAFVIDKSENISVAGINCKGSGRKTGNTKDGFIISGSKQIKLADIEAEGFQKSGLLIYNSASIYVTGIYAHDNGSAGISALGKDGSKDSCRNIYIGKSHAENNPGDPTNLTNHSGNGIIAGLCRNVVIDFCSATNNGWDMPRIGNGPVGIWCYEADSVVIQHCVSYRNKTSVGGADGGGFDFDGGVTNSIIQNCVSFENQGAGYCLFQYLYASPWHDNIVRHNISINDGNISDAGAGIYVWNSSRDEKQFYNSFCYNNTIYNSVGAAVSYSSLSERSNFNFVNNIFIAQDSLVKGNSGKDNFLGNHWWRLKSWKF